MKTPSADVVWLAALLHDIGKFRERTFEPLPSWAVSYEPEAKYSHEPYGALFVDELGDGWTDDKHTLRRAVLKHHQPEYYAEQLVAIADRLSAGERAEADDDHEGARGRAETVLQSATTELNLNGRRADGPRYYPLEALRFKREVLLPSVEHRGSKQAYRSLWNGFIDEARRLRAGDTVGLLALLRKYTWAIPSDTRPGMIPDISLYHHLKTTAAIAACLVAESPTEEALERLNAAIVRVYGKQAISPSDEETLNKPLAALVKGDISGTQDFLYLLTSSGAARGLRGRSFYLQLLTESVARWLLREFSLSTTNLLFVGGGHFYLLLPYDRTFERLDSLRRRIAATLCKAHQGDLYLAMDGVPVRARDFLKMEKGRRGFAEKWSDVSIAVNKRKQQKWSELGDEMADHLFTACQRGRTAEEMCQICHGEWIAGEDRVDGDVRKCRRCFAFEELGRKLRKPDHLVVFTVPEAVGEQLPDRCAWYETLRSFGADARIVRRGDDLPRPVDGAASAIVHSFDPEEFLTEAAVARFSWPGLAVGFDFQLLADATPIVEDDAGGEPDIADFSDLAQASEGVKWLGVLRMDVDDLSSVFRHGLGDRATIARMSTLSETLRLFFEGCVPELCRRHNAFEQTNGDRDRVYLIYAGGDDLFVVGAWSVLPELAKDIRGDFQAFVGGQHVTLSAGISIEHQKFPLYQLAQLAKEALDDRAKELPPPKGGHAKDAICFLQTAVGWERFNDLHRWRVELQAMLDPSPGTPALPRAFLARLSEIHALYLENAARNRRLRRTRQIRTDDELAELIHYDKWQWRLVYQLRRFAERHPVHKDTIENLQRVIAQDREGLITILNVLSRWADFLTRKE
jgi:CRISPR-associated protein Csm1